MNKSNISQNILFLDPKVEIYVFLLLIVIIILASILLFINNIMNSIIILLCIYILTFFLFLIMLSDFLGFMILIIYGGAIVILFIFVLMLISLKIKRIQRNNIYILFYILSIFFLFIIIFKFLSFDKDILNIIIYKYLNSKELNEFIYIISEFKFIINFFYFFKLYNFIEFSNLASFSIILFIEKWFETLFIGLILILALVYIIYIFKK